MRPVTGQGGLDHDDASGHSDSWQSRSYNSDFIKEGDFDDMEKAKAKLEMSGVLS